MDQVQSRRRGISADNAHCPLEFETCAIYSDGAHNAYQFNVVPGGSMADKHPNTSKHPYTSGSNGLVAAIAQLRKSFPATVTADTLKKLGIAPNNETYIINILRFLGIIDAEGNKVAEAAKVLLQHDETSFQKGFAGIVQAAYKDLFELHGDGAWTESYDSLITFFRNADETSDIVGRRQAATFQTLATLAGKLEGQLPKASTTRAKKADTTTARKRAIKATVTKPSAKPSGEQNAADTVGRRGLSGEMALTVRVEINLPADGDKQTYDNIFKSIRENLLNGKVS